MYKMVSSNDKDIYDKKIIINNVVVLIINSFKIYSTINNPLITGVTNLLIDTLSEILVFSGFCIFDYYYTSVDTNVFDRYCMN